MKRWTIRRQLSVMIAAICLVAVVGQVIFTQLSFRASFANYVEELNMQRLETIAGRLSEHYDETLGWELVANDRRLWGNIARNVPSDRAASPYRPAETAQEQPPKGSLLSATSPEFGPMAMAPPQDGIRDMAPADMPPPPTLGGLDRVDQEGVNVEISRGILPPGTLPDDLRPGPPPARGRELMLGDTGEPGGPELALIDMNAEFVAGSINLVEDSETLQIPVMFRADVVGYLVSPGGMRIANELDDSFSQQLLRQSSLIGIAVAGLAVICGLFIAQQFSRPVFRLNEGTDRLMRGNYDQEIPTDDPLEFGLLEQKFNRLSKTLAANRESQQRWISNISHELRTPLAVLRAELDALDAGIRKFGPDRLQSLMEEVKHLGRLVDDLFLLSRADAGDLNYQFARIDLAALVSDVAKSFKQKADLVGLNLTASVPSQKVLFMADADRIRQLIGNLINNSCAYTDIGGQILLRLNSSNDKVVIEVEDSSPGVDEAERNKIFDRLYRVEKSRNRSKGGSGLGLAICLAIAEAHSGRIEALDSELGGLKVQVTFKR